MILNLPLLIGRNIVAKVILTRDWAERGTSITIGAMTVFCKIWQKMCLNLAQILQCCEKLGRNKPRHIVGEISSSKAFGELCICFELHEAKWEKKEET
jgi:hypothetical protein